MDFFHRLCQTGPYTETLFGVCDGQNGQKAYVDVQPANALRKWIATVSNAKQVPVTFTAIDKCVIQDSDAPGRGRCDAMLTTMNSLFLLELKERKGKSDWRQHACDQLESTIQFLWEHHSSQLVRFKQKRAHACNRRKPNFVELEQELKRRFGNHGFRIDTQATVKVSS